MIKLRNANIIIKIREQKELPCGLIAVNTGKVWAKDQLEAEVTHVGPYVEEVKVGDIVLIEGDAGRWIDPGTVDPEDKTTTYRMITEDSILGVIEGVES